MLQKKKTPPRSQSGNSRSFFGAFLFKKTTYLLALKVVTRDSQSLKLDKNAAKNGGGGGLASLISQVPRKSQRFALHPVGQCRLDMSPADNVKVVREYELIRPVWSPPKSCGDQSILPVNVRVRGL